MNPCHTTAASRRAQSAPVSAASRAGRSHAAIMLATASNGRRSLSHSCYDRRMTDVASRELRNNTRALLDRVAGR